MKVLVFDIWGNYAHFKKIYATTSAVSYALPPKTSLYGYVSAILGLDNRANAYLKNFVPGNCKIGLRIMKSIVMQRINTNLRPKTGRLGPSDNRKPTTMEYIYGPCYRIYFWHISEDIMDALKLRLQRHEAVYNPVLGLSNLLSDFAWVGEFEATEQVGNGTAVPISTVIPMSVFRSFDNKAIIENENEIVEASMYAVEMDTERNVTQRESVLFDRKAKAITAVVSSYHTLEPDKTHVLLF
jgi:CRISPR-associated protein Cas5h